jgi:hypothetical protein
MLEVSFKYMCLAISYPHRTFFVMPSPFSTSSTNEILSAMLLVVVVAGFLLQHSSRIFGFASHKVKLPGPSGLPFLGNILQVSH